MANDRSSAVEYRMLEELPSPPPGALSTVTVLTAAILYGANLEGANLREANLQGADLTGAKANENTTWPDGFAPVATGVTVED